MSRRFMSLVLSKKCLYAVVFLGTMVLLSACATSVPGPTASIEDLVAKDSATRQETSQINDKLLASASLNNNHEDYVIGEGDLLEVTVFGEEDLNSTVRVGAEGAVTLPLIGSVPVGGLKAREVEKKIERAYAREYLQDPHVKVFVKEGQSGKVTLLGSIEKPGTYDYFSRQRLLAVLAMGGGLTEKAGTMVQVRRTLPGSDKSDTYFIDLADVVKTGEDKLNMEIQSGDVVFVPEAGTLFVDGAVRKPGSYPIRRNMSIHEAVVGAGGLTWYAGDTIKLVRLSDKGKREIIAIGTDQMSDQNIDVRDRDILFVETNPVKQAIYGLSFSFFGTGVSLSAPR